MRNCKNELKVLTFFVVFSLFLSLFGLPQNVAAKDDPGTNSNGTASQEELAQILAPIALYPDTLLAQMFMAATYPLEVVKADRFVKKNGSLKEDALDKALKDKKWDVSVKSICHFPSVLASMSDNLDATKSLGDYFLNDQKAVMDMVQTLRTKAQEKGNLKTTEEQKVVVEKEIIIIESANPQVVYVPSYRCTYVYGPWWYPLYPPYIWYPPPPRYGFRTGIIIGIGISSWCRPNWRRGNIDININRTTNFNNNVKIGRGKGHKSWKHNPRHRQGVAYNKKSTRKKFGQSDRAAKKRDLGRGRTSKRLDRKTRDSIKKRDLNRNVRHTDNRKQNRNFDKRSFKPNATTKPKHSKSQRSKSQRSSAFNSSNGSGHRTGKISQRGHTSRNTSRNRGGKGKSRGGHRR